MHYISKRVFSRVAVIPYKKIINKSQTLQKCLELQSRLKRALQSVLQSAGVLLELGTAFATMETDNLFVEILSSLGEDSGLDMRTQQNYALVLCATGKVC